jgi:hypothetical protein
MVESGCPPPVWVKNPCFDYVMGIVATFGLIANLIWILRPWPFHTGSTVKRKSGMIDENGKLEALRRSPTALFLAVGFVVVLGIFVFL